MVRERERDRAEERRFQVERKRWAFRFGVGVLALVCLMYFVVQPVMSAFGYRLALPDGRFVFVIVVMAGSAVWSFDPKDFINFLSGVNITYKRQDGSTPPPPPTPPSGEGGSGGGDA